MKKVLCLILVLITCVLQGCGFNNEWKEKYEEGKRYYEEKDYYKAEFYYKESLEIKPNEKVYLALADLYDEIGKKHLAYELLISSYQSIGKTDRIKSRIKTYPEYGRVNNDDGTYTIHEYENGILKIETLYSYDDKIQCECKYDDKGTLLYKAAYHDDETLYWIDEYDQEGKRTGGKEYKHGNLSCDMTYEYWENGNIKIKKNVYYNDNHFYGSDQWISEYDMDGKILCSKEYNSDGIMKYYCKYDSDENKIYEEYNSDQGELAVYRIFEYDSDDNMICEMQYDSERRLEDKCEYDENGVRKKYTSYNENGTIKCIRIYDDSGEIISETWNN